jgi:hypothetical protein
MVADTGGEQKNGLRTYPWVFSEIAAIFKNKQSGIFELRTETLSRAKSCNKWTFKFETH